MAQLGFQTVPIGAIDSNGTIKRFQTVRSNAQTVRSNASNGTIDTGQENHSIQENQYTGKPPVQPIPLFSEHDVPQGNPQQDAEPSLEPVADSNGTIATVWKTTDRTAGDIVVQDLPPQRGMAFYNRMNGKYTIAEAEAEVAAYRAEIAQLAN